MLTQEDLRRLLLRLDGRGYRAYQEIRGEYRFGDFTLIVDHVQGDPFAAPSRLRIRVDQQVAGFPPDTYHNRSRRIALEDYLTRQFHDQAQRFTQHRGTGRSGLIAIDRPGQEILERSAAVVNARGVEVRFVVGLPAQGRTVLGRQAARMLCEDLPQIAEHSLKYERLSQQALRCHIEVAEDADWLRAQLPERRLIAFVADGSILPRRSGVDPRPLTAGVIPFQSPPSLRVTFHRPNLGPISGMGIPQGVALIVGGGYHGKSTLLRAVELGIYNHIPGDGREFVVADPQAVKIRAEDGRRLAGVDISPFISRLPQGQETDFFYTDNASGSTSQAANIAEALEAGATALLIDEDTAATNFMIRDHRMQELIAKSVEPITPFIDKVGQLYRDLGVSTILVMGGSGDYFDVADLVVAMEHYNPKDVTEQAKAIAMRHAAERKSEGGGRFGSIRHRIPLAESLAAGRGRHDSRWKVPDAKTIVFDRQEIDLAAVEQLVDRSQLRAIALALVYARNRYIDGRNSLAQILKRVMDDVQQQGLDVLAPSPVGDLAAFRKFELAAAINRLRSLEVKPAEPRSEASSVQR